MNAFCPFCGNLLQLHKNRNGRLQYICESCPYMYNFKTETSWSVNIRPKRIEGVFSDDDTWGTAQKTETTVCPKCSHNVAAFFEMQTRSADEPMTVFYKCLQCKAIWKE